MTTLLNNDLLESRSEFNRGYDFIDLSSIDSDLGRNGNQAFDFIGSSSFNGAGSGQVRYYHSGSSTIIQVDRQSDGNRSAEMEIQLNGLINLTSSDFIL